jgi:metal-sulfur cluster biosynthetic enzyme
MDDDFDPHMHNPMFLDFAAMSPFIEVELPKWVWNQESEPPSSDKEMVERVIENLQGLYDPELPINVFDLGLIYKIESKNFFVIITGTLTSPNCPTAATHPEAMQQAASIINGCIGSSFTLTFDPPWNPDKMTEDGKMIFQLETGIDPENYKK